MIYKQTNIWIFKNSPGDFNVQLKLRIFDLESLICIPKPEGEDLGALGDHPMKDAAGTISPMDKGLVWSSTS